MQTGFRTIAKWAFLVAFGVLSIAGEALHLLPGCGHVEVLSSGQSWFVGIAPNGAVGATDSLHLAEPEGTRLKVLAAGECSICTFASMARATARQATLPSAGSLVVLISPTDSPLIASSLVRGFDARGPPCSAL